MVRDQIILANVLLHNLECIENQGLLTSGAAAHNQHMLIVLQTSMCKPQ
jgi:hypothetical protein